MPLHALALTLAFATTTAAAAADADAVSAGNYRYTFDGTFWNGAKRSFAADEVVARGPAGLTIRVSSDGGTAHDAAPEERSPYDEISHVLGAAPTALAAGSHWNVTISQQTGATAAETTPVPLDVRVVRNDANGMLLQATGSAHAMLSGGGYQSPTDITVRVAALLAGGNLVRYDCDTTEDVHAGPYSQQMHWKWSVARAADR